MSVGGTGLDQPSTQGEDYDNVALGTSADAISFAGGSGSVIIRAHPDNAGRVFIGWDDELDSSNGFPLTPGDTIAIDIDVSAQQIFAVANSSGDRLRYLTMN